VIKFHAEVANHFRMFILAKAANEKSPEIKRFLDFWSSVSVVFMWYQKHPAA